MRNVDECQPADQAVDLVTEAERRVGAAIRERAIQHIADALEQAHFPEASRMPRTEKAALAMIRGIADELRLAAQQLEAAAKAMKEGGLVLPANRAHQAAQRAESLANELVPQRA